MDQEAINHVLEPLFFGGNKVIDCENNFLPLVQNSINRWPNPTPISILEYRIVTTNKLNVRTLPTAISTKASNRDAIPLGSVLRIFEEKNGWYKISNSASHWVSGRYTQKVTRATVNADTLNIRNGAGLEYNIVGSLVKGTEIFITDEKNGWCKIGLETKWVKNTFVTKS